MANCENCGKGFDYEKYYGICPRCGAYNRENKNGFVKTEDRKNGWETGEMSRQTQPEESEQRQQAQPEESEQKQQAQQETDNPKQACQPEMEGASGQNQQLQDAAKENGSQAQEWQQMPQAEDAGNGGLNQTNYGQRNYYGSGLNPGYNTSKSRTAKNSGGAIALFICLIVGIVLTIAVPIFYTIGRAFWVGNEVTRQAAELIGESEEKGANASSSQDPQTADIAEAKAGQEILLGSDKSLTIQAKEAYVLVPAGLVDGFPADEKLVAISVEYNSEPGAYSFGGFDPLQIIYVGYQGNVYKEIMSSYSLSEYEHIIGDRTVLDNYDMAYGEGSGIFLVFVPQDVEEIQLYLESRDTDTNDMEEIYQIPLTIKTGEGA